MREQKREKEAAKPSPFLLGVIAAAEEDASERERTRGNVEREEKLAEEREVLSLHRWSPGNTAIDAGKCHYWSHCPCSAPVSAAVYAGSAIAATTRLEFLLISTLRGENSSALPSVHTLSSAAVPCSPLRLRPLRRPPPRPLSKIAAFDFDGLNDSSKNLRILEKIAQIFKEDLKFCGEELSGSGMETKNRQDNYELQLQ
ncbi:uncharacterized protein DS421_1g16180 [Arachis hypogaea]|nr:uncharacterized protein DS421_1g16180 [Arachis hypogaea]